MRATLLLFAWLLLPFSTAAGQQSAASITGQRVSCLGGKSAGFGCRNVDLLSFLPITAIGGTAGVPGTADTRLNDIWGWTDPVTHKEYALVGRTDGTAFVDVSDPVNPIFVGSLPLTDTARPSSWRDIKVYRNYALVVSDITSAHGMQVFDLERLRSVTDAPATFSADTTYMGFKTAHNIAVDEDTGFAYAVGSETCGGGLHMIDVSDPRHPEFAGCYAEPLTGRARTGYTHDTQCVLYHGPDADHRGEEICVNANENAIVISDVTDKHAPHTVSIAEYPDAQYTHQAWLTPDHKYLLVDDELDELAVRTLSRTRTLIWDMADLDEPFLLATYLGTAPSIDHNQYIVGNRSYQANYASGLRVLDLTEVESPREVGFFDTYPATDSARAGGRTQFVGAWSNYPFFASGIVVVSSIGEGLFVIQPTGPAMTGAAEAEVPAHFRLLPPYPNPFNPATTIVLELDRSEDVRVAVFDAQGKEVAQIFSGHVEGPGRREFSFDASRLASGVYLIRATTASATRTETVTLQK